MNARILKNGVKNSSLIKEKNMKKYKVKLNIYFDNPEDKSLKYNANLLDDDTLEIDVSIEFGEKINNICKYNEYIKNSLNGFLDYVKEKKTSKSIKYKMLNEFVNHKYPLNVNFVNQIESINFITNDIKKVYNYLLKNKSIKDKDIVIKFNNIFDKEKIEEAKKSFSNFKNVQLYDVSNLKEHNIDSYEKSINIIDDIVNFIKKLDLSPMEKVMFTYDLIRKKVYTLENEDEDYTASRDTIDVLLGDKIVCLGYANVFNTILEKLGFNPKLFYLKCINNPNEGHARSIMYLKDDKYDIEGIYLFDPTGDSKRIHENNNYLNRYTFFAKTLEEMKQLDKQFDLKNISMQSYDLNMMKKIIDAINLDKIEDLDISVIKTYNEIARIKQDDELPIIYNLSKENDISLPEELKDYYKIDKDKITKKVKEYDLLMNNTINAETYLDILYNVRKKQYYLDEDVPFSVGSFKDTIINSNWSFVSLIEMLLRALNGDKPDCNNYIDVNKMKLNKYIDDKSLDRNMQMIKLSKALRKVYENKK